MGFLNDVGDFVTGNSSAGRRFGAVFPLVNPYAAAKAYSNGISDAPAPIDNPEGNPGQIRAEQLPNYIRAHPNQFPGVDPDKALVDLMATMPPGTKASDFFINPPVPPPTSTPTPISTPDISGQPTAADAAQQDFLQKQLDKIYGTVQTQGENAIDQEFIPSRQKAIAEEAALGRLTSPLSVVPLSRLDQSKQLALGNLYGNIAGQKASGQIDVAKTIDTILNARKDAAQQNQQFLQDLNLRKDTLNQQSNQFTQQLDLDKLLGLNKTQTEKDIAGQSKPKDFLDYLLQGSQVYKNLKPGP